MALRRCWVKERYHSETKSAEHFYFYRSTRRIARLKVVVGVQVWMKRRCSMASSFQFKRQRPKCSALKFSNHP